MSDTYLGVSDAYAYPIHVRHGYGTHLGVPVLHNIDNYQIGGEDDEGHRHTSLIKIECII